MSYQQTPKSNNNATPKPNVGATPNVDATPAPIVDVTPKPVVDATPKPTVSTTPRSTVSATPRPTVNTTPPVRDDSPRRRRGFLLPLLLLLLLLALLFGIFQFFTNGNRSAQTGAAVASSQTATAAARAQGGASSSAAAGSQGTSNASATATAAASAQTGAGGATLPVPAFNNIGARDDNNSTQANFDGSGDSYSTEALQAAKFVPGQTIVVNGVSFKWPDAAAGKENNYQAQGQVVPVTPVKGATVVAFLGASSNGPSTGKGTITYSDGTKEDFDLKFTDWTTRAGKNNVSFDNHVAATMPYRNKAGQKETVNTYLFSSEIALQSGKTIRSVTLPTSADKGELHVFAIGTK